MSTDAVAILIGFLQGLLSSAVFVLVLMIGFCVVFGWMKLKKTTGGNLVIKSLDERIDHRSFQYMPPTTPRGPADQLRAPELLEAKV